MMSVLENILKEAWELRSELHVSHETNAYRLFCGEGEGIPGVVIDRLGDVVILQKFEGQCRLEDSSLKEIAQYFLDKIGAKACYLKNFIVDRTKASSSEAMYSPHPFLGEACESKLICRENGVNFELRPYDGFSYGLFFDQRHHRKALASLLKGKSVFNGFSYTCGFSVYLAKEGAHITSVDLSKNYLDWGKQNFALNQLSLEGHRFVADDVFSVLKKAVKRGEQFEAIILDPPSFSRSKKSGTFSLKNDVGELITLASEALVPGGMFFFSCNFSAWNSEGLRRIAEKRFERPYQWQSLPSLPLDFERQTQKISSFLVRL